MPARSPCSRRAGWSGFRTPKRPCPAGKRRAEEGAGGTGPLGALAGLPEASDAGRGAGASRRAATNWKGKTKTRLERVRKFYSAIPAQVEFPRYSIQEARHLALELVKAAGLSLDRDGDRRAGGFAGRGRDAHLARRSRSCGFIAGRASGSASRNWRALVPDSSVSTIFVLVDALGRRDRLRALELLDTLVRQGEYMPLALSFLATLLRLALAAKERGLRSPQQIQQELSRPGRPIWRSKAEQIHQTATVFSKGQLETDAEADLRRPTGLARRAAGRPHRDGEVYPGAGGLK